MGKGKGLSLQSRYRHLHRLHYNVGCHEPWTAWLCIRYFREFRGNHRKGPCPFTCSGGTWVLADRRCSDLRYCCKRSRCFQLQRSFWHRQYYDFRRYGQHGICPCFHGIWRSQRLRNDGFLSSLCSMYGNDRNDPQRSGKDKYHCRVRLLPACHCMDFRSDFLPYRTAVLNKRENKDPFRSPADYRPPGKGLFT